MNRNALASGRAFEVEWALRVGGKSQPGSGNQWFARMDVPDLSVLWSCKWTDKPNFTLTPAIVNEVVNACLAPGGSGAIPGVTIQTSAFAIVALRAEDFLQIVTDKMKWAPERKSDAKRRRADIPELLRDD